MSSARSLAAVLLAVGVCSSPASAQQASVPSEVVSSLGARLGDVVTSRYQIGVVATARGGPATGVYATAPVPVDWPEQTVSISDELLSPAVQKIDYRMVAGTVKQLVVSMPLISPGDEVRALITVEVRRNLLLPPADTTKFQLANDKKLPKEIRPYLLPSPGIESTNYKIQQLAKQTMRDHADDSAWYKVEALYDLTREKVQYVNGPFKGALKALLDGNGDCEELSSLFIAFCRAAGIPARTVWVPDHCYPEFYLEDADGKGYWFPCQAAGDREFGGISETRPILQKGDNFTVPEKPRDRMRYVSEYLTGLGGEPRVRFIRQLLDAGPPTVPQP